jgi:hypothetical protein
MSHTCDLSAATCHTANPCMEHSKDMLRRVTWHHCMVHEMLLQGMRVWGYRGQLQCKPVICMSCVKQKTSALGNSWPFLQLIITDYYWFLLIIPDFYWFRLIFPDFPWFILIYPDLSWFILIYTDLFLIFPDFSWFTLIYTDLYWFILIFVHNVFVWTFKYQSRSQRGVT